MPKLLKSHAYEKIADELNYLFALAYQHDKVDRNEITTQVHRFLDKFSESLVGYSRALFAKIDPKELFYYEAKQTIGTREEFKNIDEIVDYTNNIGYLAASSVLEQTDPTRRNFYFEIWIQLMNFCYLKGDFSSACSIYLGLSAHYVWRTIDEHQMSPESRIIWEKLDHELTEMLLPKTALNKQLKCGKDLKTSFIPQLSAIITVQLAGKETYKNRVAKFEEIEAQLKALDRQNHLFLNRAQREEYMTWSQTYYQYMKTVYLPQSIFEYTKLLAQYEDLVRGDYVAQQFHEDQSSRVVADFIEMPLRHNRTRLKLSPHQNEHINELLSEVGQLTEVRTDTMHLFAQTNCVTTKAKGIGKYLSKIFSILEYPEVQGELAFDMDITSAPKETEDHLELSYEGLTLMQELERMISSHKPPKPTPIQGNKQLFFYSEESEIAHEGWKNTSSP